MDIEKKERLSGLCGEGIFQIPRNTVGERFTVDAMPLHDTPHLCAAAIVGCHKVRTDEQQENRGYVEGTIKDLCQVCTSDDLAHMPGNNEDLMLEPTPMLLQFVVQ